MLSQQAIHEGRIDKMAGSFDAVITANKHKQKPAKQLQQLIQLPWKRLGSAVSARLTRKVHDAWRSGNEGKIQHGSASISQMNRMSVRGLLLCRPSRRYSLSMAGSQACNVSGSDDIKVKGLSGKHIDVPKHVQVADNCSLPWTCMQKTRVHGRDWKN